LALNGKVVLGKIILQTVSADGLGGTLTFPGRRDQLLCHSTRV